MPRPHPRPRKCRPTLADVVDLLNVADVVEPPSTLADLAAQHPDRAELALAYLRKRREGDKVTPGRRAQVLAFCLLIVVIVIGVAAGMGLTSAVLHYDGSRPINILLAFAWLVVVPAITMLLWLIAAIPSISVLRPLQDLLRILNPGRIILWASRYVDGGSGTLNRLRPYRAPFGRFFRWHVLKVWQHFAVGFHSGMLITAIWLAAFTDLAFAWSSTFDIDAAALHRIVFAIAWPLHWFVDPPSLRLVETTHYFQHGGGAFVNSPYRIGDPGQWFNFLSAAMVFYGYFPRLAIAVITVLCEDAALRHAFRNAPETDTLASTILARAVSTRATEDEVAAVDIGHAAANTTTIHNAVRVSWADADATAPHQVGGGRTLADDKAVIESINKTDGDVVITVDAAEPPVLEFDDFIIALRKAVGDLRTIAVEPRGRDAAQWAKAVARIGDPHLFLSDSEPGRVGPDSPAPGSTPESDEGGAS